MDWIMFFFFTSSRKIRMGGIQTCGVLLYAMRLMATMNVG